MNPVLSASLLAGALAVDDRSSVRLMISQPVCGGLLAGLVLGNVRDGLLAGGVLQMLFLGMIPMRGMDMIDLALGGVAAPALYILSARQGSVDPAAKGLVLFLSLVAALVVAAAGRAAHRLWERRSYVLTEGALRLVDGGHLTLAPALHFSSVAIHFATGFIVTAAALAGGVPLVGAVAKAAWGPWCVPLLSLPVLLPFIGAGSLLVLNLTRVRLFMFLAGFSAVFLVRFFRS